MYSQKIQIHPRQYRYPDDSTEKIAGSIADVERIETPEEEIERKEFLKKILDIIASQTNKVDAEKIINSFIESTNYNNMVKRNLPELRYHVGSLFNPDWSQKDNYWLRIKEIKKNFEIDNQENSPQEWKTRIEEFKKNNPIKKFTDEIYQFIISDPSIANGTYKKWDTLLDKKIAELDALGIGNYNEYRAVLITAQDIAMGDYFTDYQWTNEGKNIQVQIFDEIVRDALAKATTKKIPQEIRRSSTTELGSLSPDEVKILTTTHSPDHIYDYFLQGLGWMSNKGTLTKELVNWYLDGITWQLKPILEKLWPDHTLSKIYEKKFLQMRALASYDILYDTWASMKWWFTGNSIEKFIAEAEKWKWRDGSIGYADGVFKFYSIGEMDQAIMKNGEISWTYDSAWDSYIKASQGKYEKLEWVFGKSSIEALAIYINERKGNSTLVDSTEEFKKYIIGKLPENYIINTEKYWEKLEELTLEKDFPNLLKIIQAKWLKIPANLPKSQSGWINGLLLVYAVIDENTPPETIEVVIAELDKDFKNIKSGAQEKKWEIVDLLKEFKDWNQALESINIKNPLEWGGEMITITFDGILSIGQRKALIDQLQLKQRILLQNPGTPENNKKLETISKLLTLIDAEEQEKNATQNLTAISSTNINEMSKLTNKDDQKLFANAVFASAQATEEQKNNEDFIKRNEEIIQDFSTRYGLPARLSELADPRYLDQINSIISEIWAKKPLTEDEKVFLEYLQRSHDQIRLNTRGVIAYKELENRYPDLQGTLSNIRQANKELYDNLTPETIIAYEHIATYIFPENPITRMTRDLENIPLWSDLPLIRYYSDSDIWNGMQSSISLEDCRFTKDSESSGTIHFPAYMGIPPMTGVPVQWIESFLSQADLLVRLWFRELIPHMKEINMQISKKYWKWTNSFDGSFDIYELRRVTTVLFALVGIKLDGNETIPELTSKINTNYPNNGDVRKKLKEIGILSEDSHFRKFEFEKQMAALNINI